MTTTSKEEVSVDALFQTTHTVSAEDSDTARQISREESEIASGDITNTLLVEERDDEYVILVEASMFQITQANTVDNAVSNLKRSFGYSDEIIESFEVEHHGKVKQPEPPDPADDDREPPESF